MRISRFLPIDPDLALALQLAEAADAITMRRFRATDLVVETKPDKSPVTEADRSVEQAIRLHLERDRPADAIVGEEFGGAIDQRAGRRWILDPIDGTKNFLRGVPVWATLIGLEVDGVVQVGVASAPALGRRWWAARGSGAFADGRAIRVSQVSRLEDALVCFTSVRSFDEFDCGEQFRGLTTQAWSARGFSDFWGHVLVAEGTADAMLEPVLNLWDYAAVAVIVEEAGGRFSTFDGRAPAHLGSGLSTNGLLHEQVVAAMA